MKKTCNRVLQPLLLIFVPLCTLLLLTSATANDEYSDEYILGYVTAVLQKEYTRSFKFQVQQGVVYIAGGNFSRKEQADMENLLAPSPGVQGVVFLDHATAAADPVSQEEERGSKYDILARSLLFPPLLADPRWPHFSASYHYYIDQDDITHVGSATFGETFSLYRYRMDHGGRVELGIQAGVFSIFDLGAESSDLINADYWVGIPLAYRLGDFSALARIYHQSSHLGDEFILGGRADERINLSFEAINLLLSHEVGLGFRLYGGGGYLFHREPEELDPWTTQAGLEYRSPITWADGEIRPVAGVDVQSNEETDWDLDISARAGIQFENTSFRGRKLQLLLEYYNGHSPNGQFFDDVIHYIGLGIHYHLY